MNTLYAQRLVDALNTRPGSISLDAQVPEDKRVLDSMVDDLDRTFISGSVTVLDDHTYNSHSEADTSYTLSLRRIIQNEVFLANHKKSLTGTIAAAVHAFGNFSSRHVVDAMANDIGIWDVLFKSLKSHNPYTLIARLDTVTYIPNRGETTSTTPLIVIPGLTADDMKYVQRFESRYAIGNNHKKIHPKILKLLQEHPVQAAPSSDEGFFDRLVTRMQNF